MPPRNIIEQMATANPDGFGFVSEHDYFRTMDFNEFYKRVRRVKKSENLIMHFRWATHGSKKVTNCHPFTDGSTFFAHNGVLSLPSISDKTDSELCFTRFIKPAIDLMGIDGAKEVIEAHREGSRFAIMKDGEIHTYGEYYRMSGCLYSNLRFIHAGTLRRFRCA
ncbi:MAG: class II glutamine amidotransferase [Prevotella sp.]|nr:class II glutamine amidotransferase [Candidatus Prevotella equi]